MSFISIQNKEAFLEQNRDHDITPDALLNTVRNIIKKVREGGDSALLELTHKFDHVDLGKITPIPQAELTRALNSLDDRHKAIFSEAIENVRKFHEFQLPKSWKKTFEDEVTLGQIYQAIERVGVYIPGGRAVYPSSLIMNVVPAQIAKVDEIVVVSPPGKNGLPNDLILAVCALLGIKEVYPVGGAQSIAALAYGTESIKPVFKITGPGNQYVAEAKRQVYGKVGIDSVAGPSEILVLHDGLKVPKEFIARDLISQAEHDPDARAIFITTDKNTAKEVQQHLDQIVPNLPRTEIIQPALINNSAIIIVDSLEEGIELSNQIAPEHLELLVEEEQNTVKKIKNAGAIFIGKWTCESIGDYWAGPNHTLPTLANAKFSSPLGVQDFMKHSSYIQYSKEKVMKDGEKIVQFANLEELNGHAQAIQVRLDAKNS